MKGRLVLHGELLAALLTGNFPVACFADDQQHARRKTTPARSNPPPPSVSRPKKRSAGWFTEPSPFIDGPLEPDEVVECLNAAVDGVFEELEVGAR